MPRAEPAGICPCRPETEWSTLRFYQHVKPSASLPNPTLRLQRSHSHWMRRCLSLARRGQGSVHPNPMVGAVLVSEDGVLLGEGWHAEHGGPHAEVVAIADAVGRHGAAALKEATLYCNLEPCNHYGRTPPCANEILRMGIPRVVIGAADPNPKASGGADRLCRHGIEVTLGIEEDPCRRLNEAFYHSIAQGRPLVCLKLAQTLDGRVAAADGTSQWITGKQARSRVHRWRARSGGVLVGAGTAARDDPSLTVRHVAGKNPQRYVLDRTGRLPSSLRLFTDCHAHHTTAVVKLGCRPPYAESLEAAGGRLFHVAELRGHLDLGALLDKLGAEDGLQSLLIEAGPRLATALLRADLVDRLYVFLAPSILGSGLPAVADLGIGTLAGALEFAEHSWEPVGRDCLFVGYLREI